MKLRTAIHAADKVFIQASNCGTPIRFKVAKKEVNRVVDDYYLDADLGSDVWSGNEVFWVKNNLVLSYT
jgi:hypothetical protein